MFNRGNILLLSSWDFYKCFFPTSASNFFCVTIYNSFSLSFYSFYSWSFLWDEIYPYVICLIKYMSTEMICQHREVTFHSEPHLSKGRATQNFDFLLSGSCWKDFKCLQLSYFPFSSSSVDFSPLLYSNFFFIIFLLSFSCLFTSEAICRLRSAYLLPWDRVLKEGFRNSFLSQLKFTHAHFDLRWSFGLSMELVFSHLIDIYMPGV